MAQVINGVTCYTWRESLDMCSMKCKWWTYDMDGCYCAHPKSFETAPIFGCSTNRMIREGLCTGCNDKPENNRRELFEPREVKA